MYCINILDVIVRMFSRKMNLHDEFRFCTLNKSPLDLRYVAYRQRKRNIFFIDIVFLFFILNSYKRAHLYYFNLNIICSLLNDLSIIFNNRLDFFSATYSYKYTCTRNARSHRFYSINLAREF